MRVRAYRMSPEAVQAILTGEAVVDDPRIPHDSQVIRFSHDWATNCAIVFVEDESFADVQNGDPIVPREVWLRSTHLHSGVDVI